LGTTLILALVIVVLGVALGVGLARFGSSLPIVDRYSERRRRVQRWGRWSKA
jgi:ABC-type Fe3+ transport system permease subunit